MIGICLNESDDIAIVSMKEATELVSLLTHHDDIFARQLFEKTDSKKIILDMSNVIKIDSSGIAEVIKVHRKLSHDNGVLALIGLNPYVADSIEYAGLNGILNIFKTKEDALSSLH